MPVKPLSGAARQSPIDTLPEPISGPESVSRPPVAGEWPELYADLVALYQAVTRLGATLEWDLLVRETLEAAVGLANADSGALLLLDEGAAELYVASVWNLGNASLPQARVRVGEGVVGRVAQDLQPLLLERAQIETYPDAFPKDRIECSICAPLYRSGSGEAQVQGVLVLNRHNGSPCLNQDDVRLVSAYCTQASKALRNARCYRRVQRRAVQLENLIETNQDLIASLHVDMVLHSIIERAVAMLGCEAGSLLLVDADTQELVFKVAVGPVGAQLVDTRLPPGAGIAGAVARDGVPLIVNDAKADPRHYSGIDANTALETRTILCVPLTIKGHILGVVELINKLNGMPFQDDDRDLLAAFAAQGAVALENARLYSDLRSAFADTVRIIANALDARDTYTAGHTSRVTELALATAREMNWTTEQLDHLQIGGLLHDIGKIGISDSILFKPTELTEDEYREMMRHPIVGAKMLEGVAALRPMLPYILYHQERYDGQGYPFGLLCTEIPLE